VQGWPKAEAVKEMKGGGFNFHEKYYESYVRYIMEMDVEKVKYHHLLRAMDYLISIKEEIEKELYNQLVTLFSPDVDLVFYDLTSSYFEGEGPDLHPDNPRSTGEGWAYRQGSAPGGESVERQAGAEGGRGGR